MSITSFIKKVAVQTAVYWHSPVPDGYGSKTYQKVEEIKCRWTDKMELILNQDGEQVMSKAELLVPQELELGGWVMLIDLKTLQADYPSNWQYPEKVGAVQIKNVSKTPLLRSKNKFVYVAYI